MTPMLRWLTAAALVVLPSTAAAQAPDAVRGVPVGRATADPIALSLRDAVTRGLEQNLGIILERLRLQDTESARAAAMSQLLPQLSGSIRTSDNVLSTAAFGFTLPGLPTLIGPFGLFDARISLSAPLFDARGFGGLRSGRAEVRAAQATVEDVRDAVVLGVGTLYLQAQAAAARVDSARAQLTTADALVQLARDQQAAGIVAGIDVLQQQVQQQATQARLIAAQTTFEKNKLSLARAIGLPPGQPFTLSDTTSFVAAPSISVDAAVRQAEAHRADLRAARARVEAARAERSAQAAGHLPTVHLEADLGAIGPRPSTVDRTYSVAAVMHVPLFDGGDIRARVHRADAALRAREAELADIAAGLRYDVEHALLDLKAAEANVDVADRARVLSRQELEQAQDRFQAGVSGTLELVQAQENVANAAEQYIASLYAHALARASLARATGQVEEHFAALTGGAQP